MCESLNIRSLLLDGEADFPDDVRSILKTSALVSMGQMRSSLSRTRNVGKSQGLSSLPLACHEAQLCMFANSASDCMFTQLFNVRLSGVSPGLSRP